MHIVYLQRESFCEWRTESCARAGGCEAALQAPGDINNALFPQHILSFFDGRDLEFAREVTESRFEERHAPAALRYDGTILCIAGTGTVCIT